MLMYTLFSVRTSNFGAEAEHCYMFLRCEAENFLKILLKLHGMVNQFGRDQEIYQSACLP